MEQTSKCEQSYYFWMGKTELTPAQVCSVPCPTCGAAAKESCVLHFGGTRSGPHVERKYAAIEAIKRKTRVGAGWTQKLARA